MDSWTLCGLMNVQFSWRPLGDSAVTRGENHLSINLGKIYSIVLSMVHEIITKFTPPTEKRMA